MLHDPKDGEESKTLHDKQQPASTSHRKLQERNIHGRGSIHQSLLQQKEHNTA